MTRLLHPVNHPARDAEMAEILNTRSVYDGWSQLLQADVRLADGTEVSREIEQHGRAVAVLPYDPARRLGVLVRLLRVPVLFAGGPAELVEAPAGLIEDGEAAETAVRREAMEETGLRLGALEPVATAWSCPGVSTETIALFLAPYGEGDRIAAGGGVKGEHEGITVLERPLAEIWAMTERGEIADVKTLALVMALRLRHPETFA